VRLRSGHAVDGSVDVVSELYSVDQHQRGVGVRIGVTSDPVGDGPHRAGVSMGLLFGEMADTDGRAFSFGFDLPHASTTGATTDFRMAISVTGVASQGQPLIGASVTLHQEIDRNRSLCIAAENVMPEPDGPSPTGPQEIIDPEFRPVYRFSEGRYRYRPDFFTNEPLNYDPMNGRHCYITDGPSWHENALVFGGGSLAVDGMRHKMTVQFLAPDGIDADWDDDIDYWHPETTAGPYRGVKFVSDSLELSRLVNAINEEEFELSSSIEERLLMPGNYCGFRDDLASKSFEFVNQPPFLDGFRIDENGEIETLWHDVEFDVEPIVRMAARTSLPRGVVLENEVLMEDETFPSGTQIESTGLAIEDFDVFTRLNGSQFGNGLWRATIIRPVLDIFIEAYAKYTIKKIKTWTGSRVLYRSIIPSYRFRCLPTIEQCKSLSDGETVTLDVLPATFFPSRFVPISGLQVAVTIAEGYA
jgi:hypothetical protein